MNIFKRSSFILLMMMVMLIATGCPSPTSSSEPDTPVNPDNPDVPVKVIPVTDVKLEKLNFSTKAGEKVQLVYSLTPSDTTEKKVKWTSSDESIATVSDSGIIKTKKVGTTTISVSTENGKFKADCELTVTVPFLVLFQSEKVYSDGTISDRDSADFIMRNGAPANLQNIRAFLSMDSDDEIRDMPGNYGYSEDLPIMTLNSDGEVYQIAKNWADLLDGEIDLSLADAGFKTDLATLWNSRSKANGEFDQSPRKSRGLIIDIYRAWMNASSYGNSYHLGIGEALSDHGMSESVNLTFNSNGATGDAPGTIKYIPGQKLILPGPKGMINEGYALSQWNTSSNGAGTGYGALNTSSGPTADTTLYAQWQKAFISTWASKSDVPPPPGGYRYYALNLPVKTSAMSKCVINWGDGTWSVADKEGTYQSHLYEEDTVYDISITGTFERFGFKELSMYDDTKKRLKEIKQWGPGKWGDMVNMFNGSLYLTVSATDIPNLESIMSLHGTFYSCDAITNIPNLGKWDVSKITDFDSMFSFCDNFNSDVSEWNTESAVDMAYMFTGTKFNCDISSWNISKVEKMNLMLDSSDFSTENYDKLLSSWSKQSRQPNVNFGVPKTKYSASAAADRQILIDSSKWVVNDAGQAD